MNAYLYIKLGIYFVLTFYIYGNYCSNIRIPLHTFLRCSSMSTETHNCSWSHIFYFMTIINAPLCAIFMFIHLTKEYFLSILSISVQVTFLYKIKPTPHTCINLWNPNKTYPWKFILFIMIFNSSLDILTFHEYIILYIFMWRYISDFDTGSWK